MIAILPFLLVCYEVITYLSTDMYLPALPQMMHELGITPDLAQLTLTAWFFGSASLSLLLGPIADRYGRRFLLFLGGCVFVIATLFCATTQIITLLLIARFFQGCAACSVFVAAYATIHEIYEHKKAIHVLALMGSVTIMAPTFGPLLGGLLLELGNWRMLFWILAILAIIILLVLFQCMPETNPNKKNKFNWLELLKNYYRILCNKTFMTHSLIIYLTFINLIAWLTASPFLIIDRFHYSPLMFGVFQVIVFGGYMLGTRFVKYGVERVGAAQLIKIAVLIELCAAILTFLLSGFLMGFILAFTLYAIGAGLAYGPLNRKAIEACKEPMGLRIAVLSTLMSFAGTLASVGVSSFHSENPSSLATVILALTLLAFLLTRSRQFEAIVAI